jgi:putative transposase
MVADLSLDRHMLQDVVRQKSCKAGAVKGVGTLADGAFQSEWKPALSGDASSCSTWRYQSRRDEQVALKERIRYISQTRTRYDYFRVHSLLRREGWVVNRKRIYRLYREMGLQLEDKTPRRRLKAKLREDRQAVRCRNDCWSMDFMADHTFDGQKLRVLTIVDNFTRVSPAIEVDHRYRV